MACMVKHMVHASMIGICDFSFPIVFGKLFGNMKMKVHASEYIIRLYHPCRYVTGICGIIKVIKKQMNLTAVVLCAIMLLETN